MNQATCLLYGRFFLREGFMGISPEIESDISGTQLAMQWYSLR